MKPKKSKKLRIPRKQKSFAKKVTSKKVRQVRDKESIKARYIKRKKLYLLTLGFIIITPLVLFGIWIGFRVVRGYVTPLSQTLGHFSATTEWKENTQLNLLIVKTEELGKKSSNSTHLYYVVLNSENKTMKVLSIPINFYLEVAKGKGIYRLDKVYALGAIMEQKENMTLLKDTFEKNFALPVDRYVVVDKNISEYLEKSIKIDTSLLDGDVTTEENFSHLLSQNSHVLQGVRGFINTLTIKEQSFGLLESNLSPREFMLFMRFLGLVNIQKIELHELNNDFFLQEKIDNKDELVLDTIQLDYLLQNNYYDYYVRQEHLKTKIYNGTQIPLVATKASRLVKNIGAEVIEVGNEQETEISLIKVAHENADSETVKRLKTFFEAELEFIEIPEVERANIQVIVGKNWVEKMEGSKDL